MIKQTLLKTLYYEISPDKIPAVKASNGKDRFFHTFARSYPGAPGVTAVVAEERFLPYSVLYYLFYDDEEGRRQPVEPEDPVMTGWILGFFREYQPDFLKDEYRDPEKVPAGRINILDCFETERIPSYRKHKYAYADMEFTRYEDVHGKPIESKSGSRPNQLANFPGITFSKKYEAILNQRKDREEDQ